MLFPQLLVLLTTLGVFVSLFFLPLVFLARRHITPILVSDVTWCFSRVPSPLRKGTITQDEAHPNSVSPHLHLMMSTGTLFPNKVTVTGPRLRISCIFFKDTTQPLTQGSDTPTPFSQQRQ